MSETRMMARRLGQRMRRRRVSTRGGGSHSKRRRAAEKMPALTSGGVAAKGMKMPGDLRTEEADWADYVHDIEEGTNIGMTEMLMTEGFNGNKGVTVWKGHMLATDFTGAKGPMNPGNREMIMGTTDVDIGQAMKSKGTAKMMGNSDDGMGTHGSRYVRRRGRVKALHGSYRGNGDPIGCTDPTCRIKQTSTRAWR